MMAPYPEQQAAIDLSVAHLRGPRGGRLLITGPTGTGKSVVELHAQAEVGDGCWIVTPREEIAAGMLKKLGVEGDLDALMWANRIITPIRLRNRLLAGEMRAPTSLIFDEVQHHTAESWQQVQLLCGDAPSLGLTATAYRGTPRGTRELLAQWGQPVAMITYPEAERLGRISMPTYRMLPLIDDDTVELEAGEFSVSSSEAAYEGRLDELVAKAHGLGWVEGSIWSRPTIFALPGRALCRQLRDAFGEARIAIVDGDTPPGERGKAFADAVACRAALAHVNVVSEGIDLPLRRLIDLAPAMSPMWFMQKLGRITRAVSPGEERPEYVATNRNLLRHSYLLEGVLPPTAVIEAEAAFGPSERSGAIRALGLEGVGRFKATRVKSLSGVTCLLYNLSKVEGATVTHYACLAHPAHAPIWAVRSYGTRPDGSRDYGRWSKCPEPEGFKGFQSVPPAQLTPKMRAWWVREAAQRGLDPSQPVDRKNFAALPVLADIGWRLR